MPEIQVQHDCINITDMEPQDSFGEPVGELPKQTGNNFYEAGNHFAGTWECEPCILDLDLQVTEFCHLLEGHWVLTSESGQVTEIRAGDNWIFPNGWKGRAEVKEKVRKVYYMIDHSDD